MMEMFPAEKAEVQREIEALHHELIRRIVLQLDNHFHHFLKTIM